MFKQASARRQAANSTFWRFNRIAAAVAVVCGGLAAIPGYALTTNAPDAGSTIGNIATATYSDAGGTTRSATSNPVNTLVQQVASFTLAASQSTYLAPGGQWVYPHTLTNTGNGTDNFTLSYTQGTDGTDDDFNFTNVAIYADTNGDGVADNNVNLNGTNVAVPRGGVYNFVVVVTAPSNQTNGKTADVFVTATSTFNNTVTATNTDTATISSNAIISVSKSSSLSTGLTGTEIEYTLSYTNSGNNPASTVEISDIIPAGMTYKPNSGTWSGQALTDAPAGDPVGIAYDYTSGKVTATITSIAPNASGTIKFKVTVDNNTAPGVIFNTADFTYDSDGNGSIDVTNQHSNSVPFTVQQTYVVYANDSATVKDATGDDDTVTVPSANQGDTVTFDNYIWNDGNGNDRFNVITSGSTFPAGTVIQLYQADGVNLLQDTNNDNIPDTGYIAPGAVYKVVLKATLPANSSAYTSTGPFQVTKTATSIGNGSSDSVTDKLNTVTSNVVDLANNSTTGGGSGAVGTPSDVGNITDTGGAAWTTKPVNPGQSATFVLSVNNRLGTPDSYNLIADKDGSFGSSNDLPAGWTVTFKQDGGAGDCSTTGATITNTGLVTVGAANAIKVCAVVSAPATALAGTQNIYFRVVSPTSGAFDDKLDAVSVNTIRSLQITTNQTGDIYPNGTKEYVHVLRNTGNVTEGDDMGEVLISSANTNANFGTTLYYDANKNGQVDPTEVTISDLSAIGGILPGQANEIWIIAKVAANNAATGNDTMTITATTAGTVGGVAAPAAVFNQDVTTVQNGQVRLFKKQAVDANCDGSPDTGLVSTQISVKPGECIVYSIDAVNQGSLNASNVIINDSIPAFTKIKYTTTPVTPVATNGTLTATPADGASGSLQVDAGTLLPNGTANLTFTVRVDD